MNNVHNEAYMLANSLDIAEAICYAAEQVFEACESEKDFCIQTIGNGCIVFGGFNRVTLSKNGWVASSAHCSPTFLQKFYDEFVTRGTGKIL